MNNNNIQSHELPNTGLSNQQLLSSLNANSAAAGNAITNNSTTASAAAPNNNSHPTNNFPSNNTNNFPSNTTTNNQQGIINIPLSQLPSPTLCASCDKCRQRKTKCDGNRPCLNCITRYRKSHKLDARYVLLLYLYVVCMWRSVLWGRREVVEHLRVFECI